MLACSETAAERDSQEAAEGKKPPKALVVLATIPAQMSKIRNQRRLFTEGQVIFGSIVRRDVVDGLLKIQFRFQSPGGRTITAQSKAPVRRSSWSYDSQFFPDKPDSAAVLFLSDNEFYLL